MKKLFYSWALLSILLTSCLKTMEDRDSMGDPIPASEINIDVHSINPGSNKIVMINNTPMTSAYWDYIIGYSVRQNDTILLPFLGSQTIKFTAQGAGGPTTVERTVDVTQIDFPTDPLWGLLAGDDSDGKTWVWAVDIPSEYIYGNGEMDATEPEWWQVSPGEMSSYVYDEMKFDLNGGANYTRIRKNASGDITSTTSDIFLLNTTKRTLATANNTPFSRDRGVFSIILLTEDEMVLNVAKDDDGDGEVDTGYISMFKRKGFFY